MKASAAATLLGSAAAAHALTQQCSGNAFEEKGNWWCGAVSHIKYTDVGTSGVYSAVTAMGADSTCDRQDVTYSGPLAPLDEGLSLHFRGPLKLRQAAVYTPVPSKRDDRAVSHIHARRHAHARPSNNVWVTATINRDVVSWVNDYNPNKTPDPQPVESQAESAAAATPPSNGGASGASPKSPVSAPGGYERIAFYHSEQGTCDGVTFLGNYGGGGSGVFDTTYGLSLAYLNADGTGGAASPQCLRDMLLPSDAEFAIYSDRKCDESCGYSRAPDVAYKGFEGADKIFLLEFSMPLDGDRGYNGDMPAIWALNGRVARTAQYDSCSCWETGCGEFDIFEVLMPGDTKAKTTFHTDQPGGSSDYFHRPVDGFIKVAAVFDSASLSVNVKIVDPSTDFSTGLTRHVVDGWIDLGSGDPLASLFELGPAA